MNNLENMVLEDFELNEKQKKMFEEYNKNNDKELLNEIFESNLDFAKNMAYRFLDMYDSYDDAYIVAQEGLFHAISKFKAEDNAKFVPYAYSCIKGYLLRYRKDIIYQKNPALTSTLLKVKTAIENEYGKSIEDNTIDYNEMVDAIAEILYTEGYKSGGYNYKVDKEAAKRLINMINYLPLNNNASISPSYYDRLTMFSEDDMISKIDNEYLRVDMDSCLEELTPIEQEVINLRYGFDNKDYKTLEYVGKIMSKKYDQKFKSERIRQIEAKALRKLRNPKRANKLRKYL